MSRTAPGPRPAVSVVMPFAGSPQDAAAALHSLQALAVRDGDQLILADNSGTAPTGADRPVQVVSATGEHSPSRARNAGAAAAQRDWILFLDADCRAPADLLDRYFTAPVSERVGALAGGVSADPTTRGLAARYGAARSFLNQDAHLAHPYLPRAVAANLLVRRAAFAAVGGFYEGVRAAEDTDFSWRLQRAGWRLEGRPDARVTHRYRTSVRALRRQWRGYAAGRAWLGRRYEGFAPEPALRRAAARVARRRPRGTRGAPSAGPEPAASAAHGHAPSIPAASAGDGAAPRPGAIERSRFLALDALLGIEELAGLALSNRPRPAGGGSGPARVVLVADRFPAAADPLAEFALALDGARVEAAARPEVPGWPGGPAPRVVYREDDGAGARALALARLVARHPLRCARDRIGRWRTGAPAPTLAAIAPAVLRLRRDGRSVIVHPLGGAAPRAAAERLARLAGRRLAP